MSTPTKAEFPVPKGATHCRIVTPEGQKSIVEIKDAPTNLVGVPGKITFLVFNKKEKGAKKYTPFHGEIDNPFAGKPPGGSVPLAEQPQAAPTPVAPQATPPPAPEAPAAQVVPLDIADAPATAIVITDPVVAEKKTPKQKKAKAKTSAPKEKSAKRKDVKFDFIVSLMDGKLTARGIAMKLMHKFPNEKLQKGKMQTRTESLTPWEEPKAGEEKTIYVAEWNKAIAYVRSSRYHMKKRKIAGHYAKASTKEKVIKPSTPHKAKKKAATAVKKKKKSSPAPVAAPESPAPVAGEKQVQVCNMNSGEVETVTAAPVVQPVAVENPGEPVKA